VTLWSDEASALASPAEHVRTHWDNVAGTYGVPHRPPAGERTVVEAYYGLEGERRDGDYTLRAYDVLRHGDTAGPLSLADVHACTDKQLLQADGTIPMQVDVENTTGFTLPAAPLVSASLHMPESATV
jgi:hypothetical protein